MPSYLDDCAESLQIAAEQLGHATNALVAHREQGRSVGEELIEEIDRIQQLVEDLRSQVEER